MAKSPSREPTTIALTGATSGVGRATARLFARSGAKLGLIARGEEALEATKAEIEALGGTALMVPTDVAEAEQVADAAASIREHLGPIDLWINNAMTTVFSFFEDTDPAEFERATRVTYLGTVWGTRAALSDMLPRRRGTIIQVGSALAYRGIPLQAPYCGAKHAIDGFTESVRTELMHQNSGIHIGKVNLPALNTPQFSHCRSRFDRHPMPVPPIFQPELAAEAIELAYRKRRRNVDLGYPTIFTRLGQKAIPGLLDHYLANKGVAGQLDDRPADPLNADGNLFHPVDGDPGAHGDFDYRARSSSPSLWINENRGTLGAGAAMLAIGWLLKRS
jgi:short-subunit dehydrogenase